VLLLARPVILVTLGKFYLDSGDSQLKALGLIRKTGQIIGGSAVFMVI
jgi:hypothetical protein